MMTLKMMQDIGMVVMSFDGARLYLELLCLHTAHTFLY